MGYTSSDTIRNIGFVPAASGRRLVTRTSLPAMPSRSEHKKTDSYSQPLRSPSMMVIFARSGPWPWVKSKSQPLDPLAFAISRLCIFSSLTSRSEGNHSLTGGRTYGTLTLAVHCINRLCSRSSSVVSVDLTK